MFMGLAGVEAAPRFDLVPIEASGTHTITGNEIKLSGGGQFVVFDVRLSGWGPANLKSWQARVNSASYSSGLVGTLTPATMHACANTPACGALFEPFSLCLGGFCTAGFINRNRTDCSATLPCWVHQNEEPEVVKDVSITTPNYLWFAVVNPPFFTVDPGSQRYGGNLVLEVPANAAGTFQITFLENDFETFMADESNKKIPGTIWGRALVTILCDSADDCNDNSACTTDVCDSNGVCSNVPVYDTNLFCCDPANGNLTPISDANPCTSDTCDPQTGNVSHQNLPALTLCGDTTNTECNKPDSCDGNGVCNPRLEPTTTVCGSPTNTTCNPADTCDGAGACVIRIASAGTPCGSGTTTVCDNPDTCNGLGTCLANQVPNGTPCDDGLFCVDNTSCSGGNCTNGTPKNCADLLTCTADACDDDANKCTHDLIPNRCLINNVCYLEGALNPANTCEECDSVGAPNAWTVLPDDTECNDGNACTGTGNEGIGVDTCTSGVCSGLLDPECNDRCDVAVEAVVGQNFSDNGSTGPDDGEASCQTDSNADVWFAYTAQCDGAVFISTTGSSLSPVNDTVLSVYTDCPPGDTSFEIACDDDSGVGLNAALVFATTNGTRYLIRVAGFENNVGPITLNLFPVDDCLIDGVCYAKNDLNPKNDCQSCIPELSTTQWSPRPEGSSCGDSQDTDCDSPDACDGEGFCEVNFKTDGIQCSDEDPPNVCTKNLCASGLCTHPPEPAGLACGDPTDTDCDNPDTCDGGGGCALNYEDAGFPCGDTNETQCDNPDICDGVGMCLENLKPDDTPCDDEDVCTGTDICTVGVCAGTSILQPPIVEAIGSRYLLVTPQPPGSPAPVALLVTSPDWPCLSDYIVPDGRLVDISQRVFQLNDDWGTIEVQDRDIVPSTTYEVRAECGSFFSDPGSDTTNVWGDIDGDGDADVVDISIVVDELKGLNPPYPMEAMDLFPCIPDEFINVRDVSTEVDAVKGATYYCSLPCHD